MAAEVVATTTFVTWHEGVEVTVKEGDRLKADHAIVQAQPQWFKPDETPRSTRKR
jgi:hypothetical protein